MRLTKLEVTRDQLAAGVRFLFLGEGPVAVHTVVAAACNLCSDLVENESAEGTWEKTVADVNGITLRKYMDLANFAPNFFKHADRDPAATLLFRPEETELLLWGGIDNYHKLRYLDLPVELVVYELWFISKWRRAFDGSFTKVRKMIRGADELFPGLHLLPRTEQLRMGQQVLNSRLALVASNV